MKAAFCALAASGVLVAGGVGRRREIIARARLQPQISM
jgi:hypothetical protein